MIFLQWAISDRSNAFRYDVEKNEQAKERKKSDGIQELEDDFWNKNVFHQNKG